MNSKEIRNKFIAFYNQRNHKTIPSVSLIPENDSTLLFVNSGMFPLVPYLRGEKHPLGNRLVNYQRSFRTDDIDDVGDNRHTTFFEMLGNWSLGDYFKEEQLNWWYSFLIEEIGLDPNRLYQTVYLGSDSIPKDNESIKILKSIYSKYGVEAYEGPEVINQEIDFTKFKIFAYKDNNWWQRGDTVGELGGTDSETFYDTGKDHNSAFGEFCHPNCNCGRFIEIGNSVFMQYIKTLDGWQELKNKNVDFGGGLERLTMVSSDMGSIFETDLFFPIISKIEDLSGKKYSDDIKSFEIVADHIKASCFILGDVRGVQPSNKQQGYFVRRLIRRAIVYGGKLGIESFGSDLAKEVVNIYKEYYPELVNNYDLIVSEIVKEEEKFRKTLNRGLKEFNKIESGIVSGKLAFDLYQTYGFPIEITKELAQEKGKNVDLDDFNLEMNKHKGLSQTASAGMFKGGLADSSESTTRLHTATHILLYSLRNILGDSVVQKGSNITKERLRFDFSFTRKPTEEELKRIENMVNEIIADDLEVVKENMPLAEALNSGALSFFGEKYPSVVSVYSIGKISKEICLGPHVKRTSELGKFKIIKEESSGEGVRRIKAVLG